MSATVRAHGRELRLVRRDRDRGYWVRLVPSLRTLGAVYPQRSRWEWAPSPSAYRGDGRPGHERDGDPTEPVPDYLLRAGRAATRQDACCDLFRYLEVSGAPAVGHGPLPREALETTKELVDHG